MTSIVSGGALNSTPTPTVQIQQFRNVCNITHRQLDQLNLINR